MGVIEVDEEHETRPRCWADGYDGTSARGYSSASSRFNFDMGISFAAADMTSGTASYNFGTSNAFGDEMPGISAFNPTDDGRVFSSNQTFARGLDMLNARYHMLDLTPLGRDEDDLNFSMAWLRRRTRTTESTCRWPTRRSRAGQSLDDC